MVQGRMNEQTFINKFMELSGCDEGHARSVYIHLGDSHPFENEDSPNSDTAGKEISEVLSANSVPPLKEE